ncbi:helix-turn-helix transcriptional regulator [Rhizobium sp. BR 362]|uniref:helix-turn-helix transcriptional regulator n=1 Tax=Rhizobium sp. BR 362 TaxID=3040670 RepID=UPI002F402BA7
MIERNETLIDKLMSAKGEEIKSAREKLELSQAELASRAGTNQQTIDRLERGLTRQSKYMPEIRKVLGLPSPIQEEESLVRFSAKYGAGYGVRAHIAEDYRDRERMPVFTMALGEESGETTWIINSKPAIFLPRGYPVQESLGAYGIVVPDDRMHPVLKKGEIAIVDPDAGSEPLGEVFMIHGMPDGRTAGMLCTWTGFENMHSSEGELQVKVKFWNPPEAFLARWLTWPAMGPVVARLPAPRDINN